MRLFIIRHGQSINNAVDYRDRLCDPPLTDLGKRQTSLLAQHLATGSPEAPTGTEQLAGRSYGVTRLYCSPMLRALQTTRPVGQALDIAPEVWVDIHEQGGIYLDHGEARGIVGYPGLTRSEILTEFPNYVLPKGITERGWWHQGLEERSAWNVRAIEVADALHRQAASDERIAIVSHGGFINVLLKALLDQLPSRQIQYHHDNTAISAIDFRGDGSLDILFLNRVAHWASGVCL